MSECVPPFDNNKCINFKINQIYEENKNKKNGESFLLINLLRI